MRRTIWSLSLVALAGCDAILVPNPNNCTASPKACGPDFVCNSLTQRCQPQVLFVLGQPNPQGSNMANGLTTPEGVLIKDGKLLISDTGNHRVLKAN